MLDDFRVLECWREGKRNVTMIIDAVKQYFDHGTPDPPAWVVSIPLVGDSLDTYWRELAASREALLNALRRLLDPARSFLLAGGLLLGEGVLQMSLAAFIAFFVRFSRSEDP